MDSYPRLLTERDLAVVLELLQIAKDVSENVNVGIRPGILLRRRLASAVTAVTELGLKPADQKNPDSTH